MAKPVSEMEGVVKKSDLKKYYKGKRVFVTGHTGFKGTWLTALLSKLGAGVKGYALAPLESKRFYELFAGMDVVGSSIIDDIRNGERLRKEILDYQPDYIFHLAAQPLVLRSYVIPADTFDVNVTGTARLLESLISLKKKCSVVIITTDKVYENKERDILYAEGDRLGGHDPYSASKACTELVVESFRKSFFDPVKFDSHQISIASARAGNVIGGGDWSIDRIVPDTVTALLEDKPVKVRNPGAVRPWQHVLEPLVGYLQLAASMNVDPALFSEAYNFGPNPGDHLTVKELVDISVQYWGSGKIELGSGGQPRHEANLLKLDISKAVKKLGWRPSLTASEAIRWTIEWYRKDVSQQAAFTFKQIDNYLQS